LEAAATHLELFLKPGQGEQPSAYSNVATATEKVSTAALPHTKLSKIRFLVQLTVSITVQRLQG